MRLILGRKHNCLAHSPRQVMLLLELNLLAAYKSLYKILVVSAHMMGHGIN